MVSMEVGYYFIFVANGTVREMIFIDEFLADNPSPVLSPSRDPLDGQLIQLADNEMLME